MSNDIEYVSLLKVEFSNAKRGQNMVEEKIYILDTNVLVQDPESIFSFEQNAVGIPMVVLEELDQFKGESSLRGRNSRAVIRHLDLLREKGNLNKGVPLDTGGSIRILLTPEQSNCTLSLNQEVADNQILYTVYCMKQKGFDVKFISQDINMRVKADVIGIEAFDYVKDMVPEEVYKGWISLQVSANQLKKQYPEELDQIAKERDLVPNQFIVLESRNNPYNNVLFRYLGNNTFKKVVVPQLKWPLLNKFPVIK